MAPMSVAHALLLSDAALTMSVLQNPPIGITRPALTLTLQGVVGNKVFLLPLLCTTVFYGTLGIPDELQLSADFPQTPLVMLGLQ